MKKYRLFPKEALLNLIILILIWSIILVFIDRTMIQYSFWKIDDELIESNYVERRSRIWSQSTGPLMNIPQSDISIGEEKKILIIGDSFIEGDGYSNLNDTWWRQLQLELNKRGYYDVKVYASGKCGASTYDEMIWLTKTNMVEEVRPDIIIIDYVVNDPELDIVPGVPIVAHTVSVNYFESNKILQTIERFIPNVSYKINNMLNEKVEQFKEYNDETGYPTNIWNSVIINDKWSKIYYKEAVLPLSVYLESLEIPSFVVSTPHGISEKYKEWLKVLELFESAKLRTFDMLDEFQDMARNTDDKKNRKINYVNGHPGTLYTKFYAEYVADILENNYPSVLGKKYEEKIEYPLAVNDYFPESLNLVKVKEDNNQITYSVILSNDDKTLYMPIKKNYIKLSLEYPSNIKKVKIESDELIDSELYVTTIDSEKGYDDQSMKYISNNAGTEEEFEINEDELVSSINICANVSEKTNLKITIEK